MWLFSLKTATLYSKMCAGLVSFPLKGLPQLLETVVFSPALQTFVILSLLLIVAIRLKLSLGAC